MRAALDFVEGMPVEQGSVFNIGNTIAILKFVSITITGMLGVLALLVDYKDPISPDSGVV